MTENRALCNPEVTGPAQPTRKVPSAAPERSDKADDTVVANFNDEVRVVRSDRQWIVQYRQTNAKTWQSLSFCATKEGLLQAIKEHLLKEHLGEHYQVKKVQIQDAKTERPKWKRIVTKEALAATEKARAALKHDDMAVFGIDPAAWAILMQLPNCFSKGD